MMEYFARYSILNANGCLIGVEDISIEVDDDYSEEEVKEELTQKVFEVEREYSSHRREYFFDYVTDEDGNEIEIERP